MIRAVVIDDVEKARIALKSDIQKHCQGVKVVAEAGGVEEGLKVVEDYAPDLIFLDIRMSDGSGFDLIERLKQRNNHDLNVIFTTAHNEYAIKAFKFSALDYLIKPVDPDDLVRAVAKVSTVHRAGSRQSLELLLDTMKNLEGPGKRIALNSSEKVQIVNIQDIVRCESQRNYTLFYLAGNKQILVTKTLKEFEDMLDEHSFIRVHHSHLINLRYLKEYLKTESLAVMEDGTQVPVSVRKKEQLLKHFGL